MAGKLIGEILDYLGVEKEYTADEAALADLQTPKVTGMTPADAEAALEKKGLDSRTVGEGETVTAQVPGGRLRHPRREHRDPLSGRRGAGGDRAPCPTSPG